MVEGLEATDHATPLRDAHVVRTPENVTFEFELAGVGSRALAWVVDLGVMLVLLVAASFVLGMLATVLGGLAMAAQILAAFLILWWYAALCEWWLAGQTVGKRVVGLRTLQVSGLRITFFQAVVRNLVRIVDMLPAAYLAGVVCALLDGEGRRLGDLAAGTVVVRERSAPMPSAVVPVAERHNTFVEDPVVVHATRRITAPERDAMVALGLRRDGLPLPLRRALFARLAEHLSRRLGVPRPPFFSEEKYVLNLAAVMLGRSRGEPVRGVTPGRVA